MASHVSANNGSKPSRPNDERPMAQTSSLLERKLENRHKSQVLDFAIVIVAANL
jgi:hypothetical protein